MTKNFKLEEFNCRCGCEMPKDVKSNIIKLASQLQIIRDQVDKPITINSAYRCPKYNERIGGASRSQHMYGKASDIVIKGLHPAKETYFLLDEMISDGDILQGGLGRYDTFTHYDIRKTKARWDNTKK